jgi:hypothetical protein
MVTRGLYRGQVIFQCEYCGHVYADLEISERCEEFCGTYGSCSIRIARTAVRVPFVRTIPAVST